MHLDMLSPENRLLLQISAVAGVVLLLQTVLVLWAVRRLDELARIRERLSRLADGLALLTDTTEAGMAALARELQQLQASARTTPARAPRSTVSRRVLAAVRKGEELSTIAGKEALSESEVRLHLKLAQAGRAGKQEREAVHGG
jgi:predicted  nucleic acid-binding Zn-ribbon protein